MAVNLRKKYYGKKEVSIKNRTYRYQLDFYHNGKRIRETIKEVEFLPTDTKKQRVQKRGIVNKIKYHCVIFDKKTSLIMNERATNNSVFNMQY